MKRIILSIAIILIFISSYAGDILILTNEMVFQEKGIKIKGCDVVFKADGNSFIVPASEIFSIQFEDI